jgi:flagellar P-ring protein precursor FlgI
MMNRTDNNRTMLPWWIALIVGLLIVGSAWGVQLQDVVRIKGAESSKLVGMGLVVGLNGSGDGGKFAPAMRPLAEVVSKLIDPNVVAAELRDSRNVALVALSAEIPDTGIREGDKIDVHVSSIGPAKSLAGGRLFLIPLTGPMPNSPVFAFAEGAITIQDSATPTTGVVHRGAQLTRDVTTRYLDDHGRIHLVINNDNASWPVANYIASNVNGIMAPDGPSIARAVDQKNVLVHMPAYAREDPASFISQILQIYVHPDQVASGARVVINEQTGTIVVTGDVEISPVIISHQGLTITTVTPTAEPTLRQPRFEERSFIPVDPNNRGGAKLADLLEAFNQLKVPSADRIEIIKVIARSGKLHAQLMIE